MKQRWIAQLLFACAMSKLGKLRYDADTACHACNVRLGLVQLECCLDGSEESVEVDDLVKAAQRVTDEWPQRLERLTTMIAQELASGGYLEEQSQLTAEDCVPFYLRLYADPDGEITYTIGFNVPRALDQEEEYVDVEEEINGAWINTDVASTE